MPIERYRSLTNRKDLNRTPRRHVLLPCEARSQSEQFCSDSAKQTTYKFIADGDTMGCNVDGSQIGMAWRGARLSAVPVKAQHLHSCGQTP
jgi:hypothetical protein